MNVAQLKSLYKLALGDDWKWARALARVESTENPYPPPHDDHDTSVGLFQMDNAFWNDWGNPNFRQTDPLGQAYALRDFWYFHDGHLSPLETCLRFHYGVRGYAHLQKLGQVNYDGYVDKINDAHTDEE